MNDLSIRPAYNKWPEYDRRLRDVVAALTDEQLAIRPSPERWPVWATVGHLVALMLEAFRAEGTGVIAPPIDPRDMYRALRRAGRRRRATPAA